MPAAYRVKRSEPLAVKDIKLVFDGPGLAVNSWGASSHSNQNETIRRAIDAAGLNWGVSDSDQEEDESDVDEDEENGDDEDDEDDEDDVDYVKGMRATITGCETTSGKRITLGHLGADLLQVDKVLQSGDESLWDVCDAHSQSLAMLHKAFFAHQALDQENLPEDYNFGDILMVETVRLEPQHRGYGIGLLALDLLVQHVKREWPAFASEGLIVLDPSGLNRDMEPSDHEVVQEKLVRFWGLLGLEVLARERRRHCTFVGCWMGYERPDVGVVVPHLLR